MGEHLIRLIGDWSRIVQLEPLWGVLISLSVSMTLITALSSVLGLRMSDTRASSGPIFVVSGLIVLGLCMLWTVFDATMWALDAPFLSERLLGFLMPDAIQSNENIRAILALAPPNSGESTRLLLPAAVSMSLGLLMATAVYVVLTFIMSSALAELESLEMKPEDVLRRERREKIQAIFAAIKAGPPPPVQELTSAPLPNDRFGRVYKMLGHWSNVQFVEARFIRWQRVVIRTLYLLMFVAGLAALGRYMPIAMWVGTAIATTALTRNLKSPKQPTAEEDVEDSDNDDGDNDMAPLRTRFVDLASVAPHLLDAPAANNPIVNQRRESKNVASQHIFDDICESMGLESLYTHQTIAVAEFEQRNSVLLQCPPGSGRTAIVDALALYTVLADAERVLHIAGSAQAAQAAEQQFAVQAEATHWKWNIFSVNLAERAGKIDPAVAQPTMVFADPETVHKQLCAQAKTWQPFLSGLGLIVIPELHQYSGVRAAHLAHLLRRLSRQIHRARVAAEGRALLGARAEDNSVRFLATCNPGFTEVGQYAERIVGRPFTVVAANLDNSPRPQQEARIVNPAWHHSSAVHPALAIRDLARDHGAATEIEGYEDIFTDADRAQRNEFSDAEVIVSRMSAARFSSLPQLTSHIGSMAVDGGISVLWQPDPEPLAEWLASSVGNPDFVHLDLNRGRSLVAWRKTRAVERTHLHCALRESEVVIDELSQHFSQNLLVDEIDLLRNNGQLIERTHRVLDVNAGAITDLRTVSLVGNKEVCATISLTACGEPWQLVERATGEVICDLDGLRAGSAAYPRRVLVRHGRRFSVLSDDSQDQTEQRRILCELSEEPMITHPIRDYTVTVINRREKSRGRQRPNERRKMVRNIGGQGFGFQYRDVSVIEVNLGARRFGIDGTPRDETVYSDPKQYSYSARAALVVFPPDSFGDVDSATLHALVNLFSATLPMFVHYTEEDLEITSANMVTDNDGVATPTLAFLDLHPEGAGFAEVITLDVLRRVVLWSLALVRHDPAAASSISSRAAPELIDLIDPTGAERVLTMLTERS